MNNLSFFDLFIEKSTHLTGFSRNELIKTGLAQQYFHFLEKSLGDFFDHFLHYHWGRDLEKNFLTQKLWSFILFFLNSPIHSQLASAVEERIIEIWYNGLWRALDPSYYQNILSKHPPTPTQYITSASYVEGLLWKAIDANPPGSQQRGYASWSLPPQKFSINPIQKKLADEFEKELCQ